MIFALIALLTCGATALAQISDGGFLYPRVALVDDELMSEEDIFWTRDAQMGFEDWIEDLVEARDVADDDSMVLDILWSRDAKKHKDKQPDNWTPPKVNIAPGEKVTKDTFKCNKKKHTCSGEIDVAA